MIIRGGKGGEREEHEVRSVKAVGKILLLDLSTSMMDRSTFWKFINMYVCELYILPCVLCCYSDTKLCLTLCNPMNCSMPGFPVLLCFLEFAQIHVHLVDAIQSSHPFSINLSQHQGLFQWVGSSHQIKNWNFSFSISISNEYSGLISFRIYWFDLAIQGILKSHL